MIYKQYVYEQVSVPQYDSASRYVLYLGQAGTFKPIAINGYGKSSMVANALWAFGENENSSQHASTYPTPTGITLSVWDGSNLARTHTIDACVEYAKVSSQ